MRLQRLQLFDYRNFQRADIELAAGSSIFVGDNAQGKSNLLEAAYLLAALRGLRNETDVQLIRREALEDVIPAARIIGEAETASGSLKVEVVIVARSGPNGPAATKTVRVNGAPRRLSAAIGRFMAVLFSADDLEMVTGSPSGRRRNLDSTLAQIDQHYSAARSRYERVLTQRNHLLKRIREGQSRVDELAFWDDKLCADGSLILQRRGAAMQKLAAHAREYHEQLAPNEVLELSYEPRLEGEIGGLADASPELIAERFAAALQRGIGRDTAAGMTLEGPHRDDVGFVLNGLTAAAFASRAQQRTMALSLRLAETRLLQEHRGEAPVLLLDDVLSEMDAARRQAVLNAIAGVDQLLVTGADWDRFPAGAGRGARFLVGGGTVRRLDQSDGAGLG